jgi:hypothetical protein
MIVMVQNPPWVKVSRSLFLAEKGIMTTAIGIIANGDTDDKANEKRS